MEIILWKIICKTLKEELKRWCNSRLHLVEDRISCSTGQKKIFRLNYREKKRMKYWNSIIHIKKYNTKNKKSMTPKTFHWYFTGHYSQYHKIKKKKKRLRKKL